MGKLNAALEWARRGFPVFPLVENGREPAYDSDWTTLATRDEALIRRMWTDPVLGTERDFNIGCMCNDYVVVDIDVKKGKQGLARWQELGGRLDDTLVVQTTSGGFHCYYYGPDSSNAPLHPDGLDVRSFNGYVVAPGSVIDGNMYRVVNDRDITWIPSHIETMLSPPAVRSGHIDVNMELDKPAAIDAAIKFLQSEAPAIEGQRGDERTFITAARLVREMALSEGTAWQLMCEHWNPRCIPPWDEHELYQKVLNAVEYGTAEHGRLSPDVLYANVKVSPPPSVFEQTGIGFGNAVTPHTITPRPWLLDRALMTGAVTVLLAAGSAGKSSVSLALAAHLALGKDFAGYETKRPCKTIIYNGEDDLLEQSRRLLAVCMAYGFDYDEVKAKVMLLSPREIKITLMGKQFNTPLRNDVVVNQLTELAADPEIGLIILDPLVKVHQCDENDNVQMDMVMETLTDIAHNAQVAILVLHHTTKGGSERQEGRIGNADIARGASAVINASRIAFTLLNASQQDAEDYGLQDNERHHWVRLDDAKMNLSLANTTATWFKKEGQRIPSGDIVGVLRSFTLDKSHMPLRNRIAEVIVTTLAAAGRGSMTMKAAVAAVKSGEPLMANKTDADLRSRLEMMFSSTIDYQGHKIGVDRQDKEVLITLA